MYNEMICFWTTKKNPHGIIISKWRKEMFYLMTLLYNISISKCKVMQTKMYSYIVKIYHLYIFAIT